LYQHNMISDNTVNNSSPIYLFTLEKKKRLIRVSFILLIEC